ncbi:hypothetical protein KBA73_01075 [Patescibacteria group bacterium]|nr:hypothetical protein [Patescibacteria group bacterium]
MKITFWFRLLWATLTRFFVLLAIGVFRERFEVSPLPEWTFTVFIHLLLFLTTYLWTRWVYKKQLPTRGMWIGVVFFFLLGEAILEVAVYLKLTNLQLSQILGGYNLYSLLLLIGHGLAIVAATMITRRKVLRSVLSEGMKL